MLPQEPTDSYLWEDSSFADWINSSPDRSSYPRTDEFPSSRRIRITDLLSPPTPIHSARPSAIDMEMALDEATGSLIRSPRSADLVGLCRRNSMIGDDGEGVSHGSMSSVDNYGSMKWEQRETKDTGKAREIRRSEDDDNLTPYPVDECERFWKEYEMQAKSLEVGKYLGDQNTATDLTNKYRIMRDSFDEGHLLPPSHGYMGPRSSPTWGRRTHGSSSSDFNYDHMEIEDLMKGMEVHSDTDYDQTEEITELSRILFSRSCSPEISSSKPYSLTADGKRKASPGLEMPNFKKRYIANPLRYQKPKCSSNPFLRGKRPGGSSVEERDFKRQHIASQLNCERVVSLAHPLHNTQQTMYVSD
ncbi:hypothetical protein IFR05_012642 [Cadophora sp. M221]|nr:hypothetical protein IFR05_012642 [Cadophora sp. M221]